MLNIRSRIIVLVIALILFLAPAVVTADSIININTADAVELQTLTGIGPAISERIVEHRERFPFETIEDIMQVQGIGEGIFQDIKDYITVGD